MSWWSGNKIFSYSFFSYPLAYSMFRWLAVLQGQVVNILRSTISLKSVSNHTCIFSIFILLYSSCNEDSSKIFRTGEDYPESFKFFDDLCCNYVLYSRVLLWLVCWIPIQSQLSFVETDYLLITDQDYCEQFCSSDYRLSTPLSE